MSSLDAAGQDFFFEEKRFANGSRKILQNFCLHFPQIDSTNQWLIAQQKNLKQGTIVNTDFQHAGKGRWGRKWQSKSGLSLMFSVLYMPRKSFPIQFISLAAAVAVCDAFSALGIHNITLKWPNDILHEQKKLGGILCEVFPEFLVIGIGLNVLQKLSDIPKELQQQANSLFLATKKTWNIFSLLELCTLQLDRVLQSLELQQNQKILKKWENYCSPYKNIFYTHQKTKEVLAGTIIGLDYKNGNLLIKNEKKQIQSLFSGEITIQKFYQ